METKFAYQVSPELAEKIALEQFDLLLRVRGVKLQYLPLGMGFLSALLFICLIGGTNFTQTYIFAPRQFRTAPSSFSFADTFIWGPIGFLIGFVIGFFLHSFVRWRILAVARSAYKKMGPERTVSWNSESITFHSPFYETKVHWQLIDQIEIGPLGVYGISGRRAYFAIPGEAFPSNASAVDLINAWQSGRGQQSVIA